MESARRRIALAVVLALAGAAALFLMAREAFVPNAGTDRVVELTPEAQRVMLDSSLRALEDGVRAAPRDRWDPEYVVALVGRDPDSLYRWVQENTSWIPYRGVLRGPTGVLMDRQGNSLDRALLLAELLRRAGHSVRLARTEIPMERAVAMLPELVARRPERADLEQVAGDVVPIAESADRYGLDGKAIEQTLENHDETTTELLKRVEERVASQTTRLLETVDAIGPFAEWRSRADSALAMLRDHWWVQVETDDSWSDLDIVRHDGTSTPPMPAPLEIVAPLSVAASLHHQVTIRVVTERFTQGRLVEERVLEHTLRPSDVIGQPIVLQFWPSDWPALESTTVQTARSLRQRALEQDGWSAALVIGNDAVATAALDASAGAARPASGIGGLGDAMANALAPRRDGEDDQLTATSIDFVIDVPGRKSRVIRRSVFDLIGPAARHAGVTAVTLDEGQKLRRSLSLMMRTEILPLGAQPNAAFVAHLAARNMLANADLLRAVSQPGFGSDARLTDSLLQTAEPGVGPLYALAVLRHEAISTAVFLDQPTILTRHRFPRVVGDSVGLVDATDIVANEVGITLSESDGFMARLAQGTWDTNLEALLGLAGGPAGNAAAAFEESRNWLALTRDDKERLRELELPADAMTRIGQDLESGYTVVVPQRPVTVDRQEFSAWWRIDRQTGNALGIGENGWGQGSEYGNLARNILIVGGRAFAFEYGLCQFIPQAANSLNVIGGEFWRQGIAPSWTRPPEPGKDFEDVAVENNRVCLKQAMLQGFLATAPLLLATARYVAITRVRSLARQQAAYETGWQEAIKRWRAARLPCLCTIGGSGGFPGLTRAQARGGPIIPAGRGSSGSKPIDPLGKTEPGLRPTMPGPPPVRTRPGPPPVRTKPGPPPTPQRAPSPAKPAPLSPEEARKNWREAKEALEAAAKARAEADRAAFEATRDYVQYRVNKPNPGRGHPGDPSNWNQQTDEILREQMWQRQQENLNRISEMQLAGKAERDALTAAKRAEGSLGSVGPAPNPAPKAAPNAAPASGNQNPTVPQQEVQVSGSASRGALEVGSAGAASSLTGPPRPPQ